MGNTQQLLIHGSDEILLGKQFKESSSALCLDLDLVILQEPTVHCTL